MKHYLKEYLKLLKFAASYKGALLIAGLCMGVSAIFEGVSLGMIMPLVDRVFTNKKIIIPGELPQFLSGIVEKLNSIKPLDLLGYIIIFIPVLFLFKGIFLILQDYLMNAIGEGVVRRVRNELYLKFQALSMEFYGKKRAGELMSRVTNDVMLITNAISYGLRDLIFESMKVLLFTFLAFYIGFKISWQLPLIAFFIFPAIMIPVVRLGKRIKKFSIKVQKRMADLNSLMAETIQGAYIVKVFSREDYELDRFKKINNDYYKFTLKSVKRIIVIGPLTEFIGSIGIITMLWIIGREVIAGRVSFGVFGVFVAFFTSVIRPLKKLSNVHAINQKALAASARIYDILDEEIKVKEKENPLRTDALKDNIVFDNVWFSYDEVEGYVLKNINLDIKKGQTIALVGHSGSGKSTLVSLLPRLYDVQKGSIKIDGIDIKDLKVRDLRALVSVVSQEMVLFNSTVRDNIAYGGHKAAEEEIIDAAKRAHAYEFIKELPKGFDTIIGDRGFRLSGGQKQRIAIARAILKNSPILILDEATSQLDSVSEQLIKEALDNLMEGKTSFVIAHRLSTVQKVDRIVVLENGEIIESGTHQELLKEESLYKKLYDLQFSA